jgi:hypothetical protein
MYWPSGRWAGTFNGLENDRFGEPRAKFAINEEPVVGFTDNPDDMYVEINPRRGGKSRRRQTKKTRRGKSKRRGRKTRGRRR